MTKLLVNSSLEKIFYIFDESNRTENEYIRSNIDAEN
jgi:hypothetical protein